MNESIWYPGIAKLSSHFGFPNGTSVVASLFTCFGAVGLENIPNILIWVVFGLGIFVYVQQRTNDLLISVPAFLLFIFTPRLFRESYNVGTDLPTACFLTFGLLALADEKLDDASLLLSLAGVFKTLGLLAAGLVLPYVTVVYLVRRGDSGISGVKVGLALVLILVSLARVYVATGNPVYPALPLNLAPWGISENIQTGLIHGEGTEGRELTNAGIRHYSVVERSVTGLLKFIIRFTVAPHSVKSEYWFAPFLFVCLVLALYRGVTDSVYRGSNFNSIYTCGTTTALLVAWFYYSPLFRFVAGVLVFVTIRALVIAVRGDPSVRIKHVIRGAAIGTLLLFLVNVLEHLITDIVPLARVSRANVERFTPWIRKTDGTIPKFDIKRTNDGFVYLTSSATYCHRLNPPCVNRRSLADEEELVREYRKYNRR